MSEQEEFEFRLRLEREKASQEQPVSGMRRIGNVIAGAVRGAGSIGATMMAPQDILEDAIKGKGLTLDANRQRRGDMDAALQGMGANPGAIEYKGGKLLSEVAGTLGVGGALAKGAQAAGAAPRVVNALQSAGFTTGVGGRGAADMAVRVGAGAAVGGASAGLVDPETAGLGAIIGGALPPVISGMGKAGAGVADIWRGMMRSGDHRGAEMLAKALGAATPQQRAALVEKLQNSKEIVPGSGVTVAQALKTPEAGLLQKLVYDSPGSEKLKAVIGPGGRQATARAAALERVAPTSAMGFRQAQSDLGDSVVMYADAGRKAARSATSAKYNSVPQDEAAFYLPDLAKARDKHFGPGVFVDRAPVDRAVAEAQKIGTMEIPGVSASTIGTKDTRSLAQAVRRAGGISSVEHDGLRGELAGLSGDLKNLVRTNGGMTPGRMAEKMREAGYLPDEDAATLLNALREEAGGRRQFGALGGGSRADVVGLERSMGEAPGATVIPKKVTLKEFEGLRSSIGLEARKAAREGNEKLAASLRDMRAALDDRIDEVVRGDGAMDEILPIQWADDLSAARKMKVEEVRRWGTGPQRDIFREGADGERLIQGAEVAGKFWGGGLGAKENVKSFRRMVEDNPEMLGQFRSMITTQGASTSNAAGDLSIKFSKWVGQNLPALKEAFPAKDVATLRKIAADIERSQAAIAMGGPLAGSDTHQKLTNALSLGVLDSPVTNRLAGLLRVPYTGINAGTPALDWIKTGARERQTNSLAALMADSQAASNALAALAKTGATKPEITQAQNALGLALHRSAPVALSR
jgi:hypothetical protein